MAVQLSGAMHTFWFQRRHYSEGRRWLTEAQATGNNAPAILRARMLNALGHLVQQEDDHKEAIEWLEAGLALYREAGDIRGIASILRKLAFSAMNLGNYEQALVFGKEGLALGFEPGLRREYIKLAYATSGAALFQGDFAQAEASIASAVALREEGAEENLSAGLNLEGLIAHYQGEYGRAQTFYDESLSIARLFGYQHMVLHTTLNMGDLALVQSDPVRAAPLINEGLRVRWNWGASRA